MIKLKEMIEELNLFERIPTEIRILITGGWQLKSYYHGRHLFKLYSAMNERIQDLTASIDELAGNLL